MQQQVQLIDEQIATFHVIELVGKGAMASVYRAFDSERSHAQVREVEAFTDAYFALLRELPELSRYVALSDRMKIVLGDVLVVITAARPEPKPAPERDA